MVDSEVPEQLEALRLGAMLDAHHPATDLTDPPPRGTCDRCGFLMYRPATARLRHLPSPGEHSWVETWIEEHL